MVTYLQSYYFAQLIASGYHILYSLPIYKAGAANLPAGALTDVTFQIYSQTAYDRHNWGQVTKATEPVMLILGMTNYRALAAAELKYSSGWIARASRGISYGTVCLSRKTFHWLKNSWLGAQYCHRPEENALLHQSGTKHSRKSQSIAERPSPNLPYQPRSIWSEYHISRRTSQGELKRAEALKPTVSGPRL